MLVGQTIGTGANRFEILRELGSGAMGTVYKAMWHREEKEDREVALKVVALGLLGNESAMARFDREATILKQLRHPHIVRLYATGHYRKTPFIAMEFIEGEALDRALARRGRLTWEEVAAHGKQLCEALQHAHDRGIIHRDLKPSNLMITRDGTLKLTDFGIAKDTDVTALTGANSTIGTAAYMSPEQCKGDRNLTHKSDLYSLGVVFFELLSNKKPFTADTTVDMFLKHVNEPPPRVGKIVPDLPPKFEALVLQLLEKDKESRPLDAAWVGRMLAEIEEDAIARKSAGLDAASARKVDRPYASGASFDEADREAARALRGKKKKKKKKAAVPFLQQKWVQATGILLVLGAMGVGTYLMLRPPSAEKLSAAIADAKTPDDRLAAAEKYLAKYGDEPGEATDRAAAAFRKGKVIERDRVLTKRLDTRWKDKPEESDDHDAYTAAMQALQAERDGQLKLAADLWGKVKARFPNEANLPFTFDAEKLAKALWGWLADEHLKEIAAVRDTAAGLEKKVAAERNNEKPIPYNAEDPESVAMRAIRLRQVGGDSDHRFDDAEKAGREWDKVISLTKDKPEQRDLYLLATSRRVDIPKADAGAPTRRFEHVSDLVNKADATLKKLRSSPSERREWVQLRITLRDITELYDDETGAPLVAQVKRAKQLLNDASKES
jgi:serine/threonine-protein kinase